MGKESKDENGLAAALLQGRVEEGEGRKCERIGIDDMLTRHTGEFGKWQLRHFVLTSLAWALEAFHTMVMIFADQEPPYSTGSCAVDPRSWEWTDGPGSSTVSEWGLVCGDKYKVGLVQSVFFAGCMIGAGIFGHLSDSFLGRKGSLVVVCLGNFVFGVLTSLSPEYWIYTLLRFLTGVSTGGVGICAFILATEPVGPNKRGTAGMSTFYFFSGGIGVLSLIAYVFRSWRALYVVSSIPSLLFLLLVLPFLSESPRWYLVRGKTKEAMDVMKAIAVKNGRDLPETITLALDDDNQKTDVDDDDDGSGGFVSGNLIDVVRSPVTRVRLLLTVAINFMCSIVYYGLSLNVVNLKTNLYLSVALNAFAEMPAFLLTAVLLDRFGRRPLAIVTMWLSGAFCVAGSMMPAVGTMTIVRMVCGIVGIFGMAGTYNLLFIYTAELFPTVVRSVALGCGAQASQTGAILAPFVVVLGERIPFAVFGVCGILGGMIAFYLPETKNKPLYDTMAGMEDKENRGGEGRGGI